MNGVLVIDKPEGFTSFDAVACLRRAGGKKIGHTGTLDPMATGVLPLLFGSATRAASLLEDQDKEYEASFALGWETDTQDRTGKTTQAGGRRVSRAALEAALEPFRGDIWQTPPMYSAVRVNGRRLYDLARSGVTVPREKRPVTVYRLELTAFDEQEQAGALRVRCSKGTYIRTLCADLARAAGTLGTMTALRRICACGFTLADAVPLEEARAWSPEELEARLLPVERLFSALPEVSVTGPQAVRFGNGGALDVERLRIAPTPAGTRFRVYAPGGRFLGLGETGGEIRELRVLRLFPQP